MGEADDLERLARLAGVQASFVGHRERRFEGPVESVLAALRALGHDVRLPEDAGPALAAAEREAAHRVCRSVLVARGGADRVEAGQGERVDPASLEGVLEHDGREHELRPDGRGGLSLPGELEIGVHRVRVSAGGRTESGVLVVCPRRCRRPAGRKLAAMLPLYAQRPPPATSLGVATYSELGGMASWAGRHGAGLLGTLPLLAAFLDEPFDPSPYAPISRERWSELFVDPRATPEYGACEAARAHVESEGMRRRAAALAEASHLDYRQAWALVLAALESLAECAFASERRRAELTDAARRDPGLLAYAVFRAWCHKERAGWSRWSSPVPDRSLEAWLEDKDFRTFLYAQVVAAEQLAAAERAAEAAGGGLYLDLPVGVSGDGFDTWRDREAYAEGFTVGAPPDAFFAHGQNWGFRPPNPATGSTDGHAALRRTLSAHLSRCGALRIDHVMMLHRLFWIPEGGEPADGVYVRYPAEELYPVVAVESHLHDGIVIGEDLGVVPEEVREAMADWGMLGMSVAQFEFGCSRQTAIPSPKRGKLSCLGTHDTPTFAAFWTGADIDLNRSIGVIDRAHANRQRRERRRIRRAVRAALGLWRWRRPAADVERALSGLLERLSASEAEIVLVNLEDLWLETKPQNVPGVPADVYPNWRRRVSEAGERALRDGSAGERLTALARRRPAGTGGDR